MGPTKSIRLKDLNPFSDWPPLPWEGRRKALLIGISYRWENDDRYPRLKGPPNDIKMMKDFLINRYGFEDHDIVVMTDGDKRLSNTALWPTRENIVKQIEILVQDARQHDFFIFHFSGHCGQREAKNDPNEEDGKDEVLIGCDFLGLLDDDIHEKLVDPLPSHSRLTAILDACHSGTLLDLPHDKCHVPRRVSSDPGISLRKAKKGSLDGVIAQLKFQSEGSQPVAHLRSFPSRTWQNAKSRYASMKFKVMAAVRFSGAATKQKSRKVKHLFMCGEKCQLAPHNGAVVVSLSACLDRQLTWEDKRHRGAAMTVALISILEDDLAMSLECLMQKLRHNFWATTHERHLEFRKVVKQQIEKGISAEQLQELKEYPFYHFDPQVPQLGGMRRLPMTETLMPVRRVPAPLRRPTAPSVITIPFLNVVRMRYGYGSSAHLI